MPSMLKRIVINILHQLIADKSSVLKANMYYSMLDEMK